MKRDDEGSIPLRFVTLVIILILSLMIAFIPHQTVSYAGAENNEARQEQIAVATSTEEIIKEEQPQDPHTTTILQYISHCESRDRQFEEDGSVLRNAQGSSAIGKYQIMESVWGEKAEELGYDLYTEKGNTQMAHYILTEGQGVGAWSASNECFSETFGFIIHNNTIVWN